MAIFKRGNMWDVYDEVDLFCVTSNSSVKEDGRLVMGAGIAKQARHRFKDIDLYFGNCILNKDLHGETGERPYGLMKGAYESPYKKLHLFQVKYKWHESAKLRLIKYSTFMLFKEIVNIPTVTVALNFPGIGNGGLDRSEVLPIISLLPDNVQIWEY